MTGEFGVSRLAWRAVGWVIGVALIGVGLLGVAGGSGVLPLAAGIVITPRTRQELYELCEIWVESGGER